MTTTRFKGESGPKKIARSHFWDEAITRIYDVTHHPSFMVIGGSDGGDIGVLLSSGIEPQRIVALDIDKDKTTRLARRWPDVTIVEDNVFTFGLDMPPKSVDVVFLDMCGRTNLHIAQQAARVASHVIADRGLVCFGFSYGRERKEEMRAIAIAKQHLIHISRGMGSTELGACARALVCLSQLGASFADRRRSLLVRGTSLFVYNSDPTPMYYLITEVHPNHSRACRTTGAFSGIKVGDMIGVHPHVPKTVDLRKFILSDDFADCSSGELAMRFFPEQEHEAASRHIAALRAAATKRRIRDVGQPSAR